MHRAVLSVTLRTKYGVGTVEDVRTFFRNAQNSPYAMGKLESVKFAMQLNAPEMEESFISSQNQALLFHGAPEQDCAFVSSRGFKTKKSSIGTGVNFGEFSQ